MRERLRQTIVRAPMSGFVTKVNTYPGQKVYEGWDLLTIVDINQVVIEAKISPGLLKFVYPEKDAKITVYTVPPTTFSAKISSVGKVADPTDQMCRLRIIIPNKEFAFQPGFRAKVEISTKGGK